ncbi:hypothetical protein G195_004879 [Phytophthora kernoviae 00238/432]|uniref:NADP-dependent oxidoreductase domain-containing protein n=1 Tax=Phytophthora kernoviae 00238/432 TaxID=1284355 RepID=A0A8J4W8G9_9STRA|nr:hypothetical protein G195_004879 [Phytophthora kernoviae 00238/432]
MMALDHIVRSGKALYVGISNYPAEQTKQAAEILKGLGTPLLIHQPKYSMLDRWIEDGLQDVLHENGTGSIAFCPLAQGVLTNKYLNGIPEDSRAKGPSVFLNENNISPETLRKVTSALIGASRPSQIEENVAALSQLEFSTEELERIESILRPEPDHK